MMISSIEALGVFVLAVLPGFVCLRTYAAGRAPFRGRSALGELGTAVLLSLLAWSILYLLRGEDLLPVLLGEGRRSVKDRVEAFAELAGLAVLAGVALGLLLRLAGSSMRVYTSRAAPSSLVTEIRQLGLWRGASHRLRQRLAFEIKIRALPPSAWDRLLTRLNNRQETVLCRVAKRSGGEVYGAVARDGYADWQADGRDLLLVPELRLSDDGLTPVAGSRGVFIPGDEIASLHVVTYPLHALQLDGDD